MNVKVNNLDNETSNLKSTLSDLTSETIKYHTQYLISANKIENRYWYVNGSGNILSTENQALSSFQPFEIEPGRYFFFDLYTSNTYIVRKSNGEVTKLSETPNISNYRVDVQYESIVYVSFATSKYNSAYFADNVIYNTTTVPRGRFDLAISDNLVSYIENGEVHKCTFSYNGHFNFYRSVKKGDIIKLSFDSCTNASIRIYLQCLTSGDTWENVISNLATEETGEFVANSNYENLRVMVTTPSSSGEYTLTFVSPVEIIVKEKVAEAIEESGINEGINEVDEKLYGNITKITVSSQYKTTSYAFEEGHFYKFTLVSNSSAQIGVNVDIKDSNDNTIKTIYLRSIGGSGIWSCNSDDAVAIKWGSSGTSVVSVNDMTGLTEKGNVFWCGHDRELNTLKAGIEEATKYMNSTLYVDEGIYDLVEEFGIDFFNNLDAGTGVHAGLKLGNGIHIIFSPNSKVVSHYTGDNQYAQSYYSPFNAEQYGFEIENLTLVCSRCRYAVHDERDGGTELCKSIYKNCKMFIDNTDNDYWQNVTPIGGGLGSNHYVEIENCIFDSAGTVELRSAVYYHCSNDRNNVDYKCYLVIKDCYMIQGTVVLDMYRQDATKKTPVIVTNCSLKAVSGAQSNGLYYGANFNPDSVEVYAWNNEIRS